MADIFRELQGKKIALVFGNLELGGAERQGLLLADYLQKVCGAQVQVVGLSSSPGRLSDLCDELGIKWSGVPFHWGLRRRLQSFSRAVRALSAIGPDILISYTRVPNMVCALGWRRIGAKLCIWNQADEGLLMNRMPHYLFAVAQPHCFISNSSGGRDFLVREYGKSPDQIHVIYNGIAAAAPQRDKAAWREELRIGEQSLAVCMIANLSAYKDHGTLVRAWKEVLDRGSFAAPPVLILGGRFDGEEKGLLRLAGELGIAGAVRMPGRIADVPGLLGAVDLFAYSSKSEGVPNAVLEAMAAGLAVVGSDIPGIREAVGADGSAYLAGVGDSGKMAEKILALLQDKELRDGIGRSMKRRIEDRFSLDTMCRTSAELICASLQRGAKP